MGGASLPWPDAATDVEAFDLSLRCSSERAPDRELRLSPRPRRGSRLWGRADGAVFPFREANRLFSTSRPLVTAVELESWFIVTGASVEDRLEERTVGTASSPADMLLPKMTSHRTGDQLFGSPDPNVQAPDGMATVAGRRGFPVKTEEEPEVGR